MDQFSTYSDHSPARSPKESPPQSEHREEPPVKVSTIDDIPITSKPKTFEEILAENLDSNPF
jgi:hypothetical protein